MFHAVKPSRWAARATAAFVCAALAVAPAAVSADDDETALKNGGFESGTFRGWHISEVSDFGDRWSVARAGRSPISGFRIPAPPQGRWQAVVDQQGPGSHVLWRDIAVDDDDLGLTMKMWYRNRAGVFFSPRTLNPSTQPNQQLRIDLLRHGVRARSMDPHDILATVFRTVPGSRAAVGPRTLRFDLSRFEDRTVRLRIAEVDNLFFFQVGIDAVRLVEIDDDDLSAWRSRERTERDSGSTAGSPATVEVGRRYVR